MSQLMSVLVVGSGGREHALAWALARSYRVKQVYVAPGNAGTQWAAAPCIEGYRPYIACENVDIAPDDFEVLIAFAQSKNVGLTVIGPEVPLAAGIVDAFHDAGLKVFGPTQAAAQIEASKAFSKALMRECNIPTAEYAAFNDVDSAIAWLRTFDRPVVVKADGLAAGKGVILCDTREAAEAAVQQVLADRVFGDAGTQVVIEERLTGNELSVLAFTDGKTLVMMPPARDHKRVGDGDTGLNTGGMGAYAPVPGIDGDLIAEIRASVLQPAIDGMAARGMPYVGVLYAGLMLTPNGIKTLEFNARFGDPETQVILPLLDTDLTEILLACVEGRLDQISVEWQDAACATVVLASAGYPEAYPTGLAIRGVERAARYPEGVIVFHAGTAKRDGEIVTNGGRVLAVSAVGVDLTAALEKAYATIGKMHFEGMHYRRDIGQTGVQGD